MNPKSFRVLESLAEDSSHGDLLRTIKMYVSQHEVSVAYEYKSDVHVVS